MSPILHGIRFCMCCLSEIQISLLRVFYLVILECEMHPLLGEVYLLYSTQSSVATVAIY